MKHLLYEGDCMSEINLNIGNDYPLNGVITAFEAYMFITKPKFIVEHFQPVMGELVIVDGNRQVFVKQLERLSVRKSSLELFNRLAKAQIPSIPDPDGLSCCMIDFVLDEDCCMADCNAAYREFKKVFIDFMKTQNKVAVMVQHWMQYHRYPHVHILYQRDPGKHEEFQEWLWFPD